MTLHCKVICMMGSVDMSGAASGLVAGALLLWVAHPLAAWAGWAVARDLARRDEPVMSIASIGLYLATLAVALMLARELGGVLWLAACLHLPAFALSWRLGVGVYGWPGADDAHQRGLELVDGVVWAGALASSWWLSLQALVWL